LVNREEMVKAIDEGNYFRIPADTRDLNYNKFFTEGQTSVSLTEEYTSHSTRRLNIGQLKDLLLKLRLIRTDVMGEKQMPVYEP